jgi:dihydroneopterin aldolase
VSETSPRNGTIRISNMRFWGKHGANPGERDQTQPIDVDLEIVAEIENAIASDDLAHAIDYAALYQTCERVVTQRSFALLETLADGIAEAVCGDTRVAQVTVRVRKPRLLDGATPEIELRRSKRTSP